jgi:serine/threonine protein kinase
VWGIGATLYEAATAVKPFNATEEETSSEVETGSGLYTDSESVDGFETDTDLDSYEQVLRRAEPVRVHRRMPAAFADIVDSCLEPDAAQRPTVGDLQSGLSRLV